MFAPGQLSVNMNTVAASLGALPDLRNALEPLNDSAMSAAAVNQATAIPPMVLPFAATTPTALSGPDGSAMRTPVVTAGTVPLSINEPCLNSTLMDSMRTFIGPDAAAVSPPSAQSTTCNDTTLNRLEWYFSCFYNMIPVLDREDILTRYAAREHSLRFRALLRSVIAVSYAAEDLARRTMRISANTTATGTPGAEPPSDCTVHKELYAAGAAMALSGPAADLSEWDVVASLNLSLAWGCVGDSQTAWYYLQQGLAVAEMINLDRWDRPLRAPDARQVFRLKLYYML